jgi:hypothetical protein
MGINGLEITEEEFCNMKQKDQNLILFRNINEIKKSINGYKFYYKLTSVVGSVLIVGVGTLYLLFINHLGVN